MNVCEEENYDNLLEIGNEFQDFVIAMLIKHKGIVLSNFSSQLFQYKIGEGYQGFEIKLDRRSEKGENLLIEIGERKSKDSEHWVDSGIYRNDNTDFYIVGNYKFFYVFDVKVLRKIHKNGDFLCHKETKTGKFFLIKKENIEKQLSYICKINCGTDGEELLKKLEVKAV